MARIAVVVIPREKRVEVALTYIYGVGRTRSSDICEALNIGRATRVRDLTDEEIVKVRNFIDENYTVEGDSHIYVYKKHKLFRSADFVFGEPPTLQYKEDFIAE